MNIEKITEKEINLFFKELSEFCELQKLSNFFTFENVNLNRLAFSETFRSIVSYNFSNSVLSDLLISKMEGLVRYSPASASFLPFFINHLYNSDINLEKISNLEKEVENPKLEDIESILDFCFKDAAFINEVVSKKIFQNNGFISDFQIKPSLNNKNAIIFSSGLNLKCSNFVGFFESVNSREFLQCNVVLYDGFIESVSEINHILTNSNENKSKFIIVCTGASMDVQNTCAVNLESEKAHVFLAFPEVNFWNKEFNEIKNHFSVYGLETGTLLNNFEENSYHDCIVTSGNLYIRDIDSDNITKANTEIYLRKESWGSRGILSDQLNYLKGLLQQIATCGIIRHSSFKKNDFNIQDIFNDNLSCLPAFPVIRALKESEKFCSQIFNTGRILRIKS